MRGSPGSYVSVRGALWRGQSEKIGSIKERSAPEEQEERDGAKRSLVVVPPGSREFNVSGEQREVALRVG